MAKKGGNGNDSDNEEYDVGYKKPPKHSQFQKGTSGNPEGTSKKKTSIRDELCEIYSTPVTVTVNGEERIVSLATAIALQQALKAAKGDVRCAKQSLEHFEKHVHTHIRKNENGDNPRNIFGMTFD